MENSKPDHFSEFDSWPYAVRHWHEFLPLSRVSETSEHPIAQINTEDIHIPRSRRAALPVR